MNPDTPPMDAPVQRIQANPGDVIVFCAARPISPAAAEQIKTLLHAKFPNNEILILDSGAHLEVIGLG